MIMLFTSLCLLLMTRPLISSMAFPLADLIHTACLLLVLLAGTFTDSFLRRRFPLKLPGLLMLAAVLFSWARSGPSPASSATLAQTVCGLLLFWQASVMDDHRRERLTSALLASLLPVLLLAGYQFLFGFNRLLDYFSLHGSADGYALEQISSGRVFLPFVTANALGGFVAMLIPLSLTRKTIPYRALLLAACCVLVISQSIAAMAALAVSLMLALAIKTKKQRAWLYAGAAAFTVLLSILVLRWNFSAAHQMPLFSLGSRLGYWEQTLQTIRQHPLLGSGLDARTLASSLFSHNAYLQMWSEQGLPGLIALLCFTGGLLGSISTDKRLPWQLWAAACVFLLHNLFDFTFFLPEVALAWWAIAGLAVAPAAGKPAVCSAGRRK